MARQGIGDGPGLDGERPDDAAGSQRRDQARVHAQFGEAGLGRLGESGGRGERRVERGARIAARLLAALLRATRCLAALR